MKTIVRITTLALVLALMLPFMVASAQDGGEDELALAPEVSAVYYLSASAGSFADNGDGTYTLTLEGVGEELVWIMAEPVLSVNSLDAANFSKQWAAAADLTTDAALEVAGLNVMLTLSSPAYEAGVQTFVATVDGISAPADVKDPELPMAFESANLSIGWSVDFQNGLVVGIVAIYEELRATPEECANAQTAYNDWLAWDNAKAAEFTQLARQCNAGNAAACTQARAIRTERYAAYASITPVITLLNTEC